jgi:uncharacterized protein (TIGR03067 family)
LAVAVLGGASWISQRPPEAGRHPEAGRERAFPAAALRAGKVSDRAKLQGTWVAVSIERDGEKHFQGDVASYRLTFAGDRLTFHSKNGDKVAPYRLDPTQKPKAIDIDYEEGITTQGIYELTGDRLKLCYTKGGERPAGFDTTVGEWNTFLFIYERKK